MRCSLYGKLMSKRDFVAVGAPRAFLDVWEPWLQAAISSSRDELGRDWQSVYLTAPIWRFWLGAELCGHSVIGAFMPSLDGIGRYFPLTALACADDGRAIAPPELDAHDQWFEAAENFLMSTLDQAMTFEAVTTGLDALPLPATIAASGLPGVQLTAANPGSFGETFTQSRLAQPDDIHASATFWWTAGGENFPAAAVSARRMPDPYLYTAMLTGTAITQPT